MNSLVQINNFLSQQDLFALFKIQLKKDFESCGQNSQFIDALPSGFDYLREVIAMQIIDISKSSNNALMNLLYRIDINEKQIKNYANNTNDLTFENVIAELIIKRILQKVILKKHYSS